jgi:hypothetical protein
MHSPHLTHFCKNCSSGRAPGGRINFSEALFLAGVSRKNGRAKKPNKEVKMSLRLDRLTVSSLSEENFIGHLMASVGQMALQVKQ